ncbi:MAG: hypothetical protein HW421_1357 [Ignavibacteria bacterium]|nr:hypothetical protein [Ignavibacteria bacterium]
MFVIMKKSSRKTSNSKISIKPVHTPKFFVQITKHSYLLIIIFCLSAYGRTAFFDFVHLDDYQIIVDNNKTISDITKLPNAFMTNAYFSKEIGVYYRPILSISFMLDAQIGGASPMVYHISNIIYHCIVACLLFYLLGLLGSPKQLALALSLMFAVHPLFNNAVCWIVARNDLLATVFSMGAFIYLIKYHRKPASSLLFIHFVFYIFAVFSKEISLFIPGIFILYILIIKDNKLSKINYIYLFLVWTLSASTYLILRNIAFAGLPAETRFSFDYFLMNLATLPELLGKFFYIRNLSPLPMFNSTSTIVGLIFLVLIIIMINRKKSSGYRSTAIFGFSWFVVLIIPGMFSKLGDVVFDYLECRAYLPAIGLFIMCNALIMNYSKTENKILFNTLPIIIILLILNWNNNIVYQDAISFYSRAIETSPRSAMALNNRGIIYKEKKKFDSSIQDFTRAIEINPGYDEAYYNRGLAWYFKDDFNIAINDFSSAISLNKKYAAAYNNRALARVRLKDFSDAKIDYDIAISLMPKNESFYYNRGIAFAGLGHYDSALADYTKAIQLNPNYAEPHNNRGVILGMQGAFPESIADFDEAVKIKPDYGDAYFNRGFAHYQIGNRTLACDNWQKALVFGHPEARRMLEQFCK